MQAVFYGTVIAGSDHTAVVEGNHYFPTDTPTNVEGRAAFWRGVDER